MMKLKILGAALFAAGALWADDPSITLNRVQQRYPWNGMVDIDYTVANVPSGAEASYYVRFKVTENGNTHVLHEMLDASSLVEASNGTYRVTWNSAWEDPEYRFFTRNANVQADLVYCGEDKSKLPYGDRYVIIDLTAGTTEAADVSKTYPVETCYIYGLAAATAKFSTTEYKTTKLVLRRVRAGTFIMGSPAGEPFRESGNSFNKETQHQVTLTQNYLLGIFPVTQTQYLKVMGGTNPAAFPKDAVGNLAAERPIENVSYEMIRGTSAGIASPAYGNFDKTAGGTDSFLGRLERRTGLTFDLPTEAQWEYACRAGTTTCTYIGDYSNLESVFGTIAWYSVNNQSTGANAYGTTHAVGQKIPNAWGVYDTLGNVWEWCRDRVSEAPNDDWGTAAVTDPLRAVAGGTVTVRGGSWPDDAKNARAACRPGNLGVSFAFQSIGFRLSRTLP